MTIERTLIRNSVVITIDKELGDFEQADILIEGVPLSDRALGGRGFHQTADLITQLRHELRLPPPEIRHALSRLGTNKAQKALGLHARADNLSGTFMVNASAIHGIEGRHLALIDDVSTTGATLSAVTDVLLRAGAASVNTVVLARTPKPDG